MIVGRSFGDGPYRTASPNGPKADQQQNVKSLRVTPSFCPSFWSFHTSCGTPTRVLPSTTRMTRSLRLGIVSGDSSSSPPLADLKGVRISGSRHIYLIGNSVIWWSSSAAIFLYVAIRSLPILCAKRGYRDFDNSSSSSVPTFSV